MATLLQSALDWVAAQLAAGNNSQWLGDATCFVKNLRGLEATQTIGGDIDVTLVTPRIVQFSRHWPAWVGGTVLFAGQTYTVTQVAYPPSTGMMAPGFVAPDIGFGLLDRPVVGVAPMKLLPINEQKADSGHGLPAIWIMRRPRIAPYQATGRIWYRLLVSSAIANVSSSAPPTGEIGTILIAGDSSSPLVTVVNGEAALICTAFTPYSGSSIPSLKDACEACWATDFGVSDHYTMADLSGFDDYAIVAPPPPPPPLQEPPPATPPDPPVPVIPSTNVPLSNMEVAPNTWIKIVDGSLLNPGNWGLGALPSPGTDVTIDESQGAPDNGDLSALGTLTSITVNGSAAVTYIADIATGGSITLTDASWSGSDHGNVAFSLTAANYSVSSGSAVHARSAVFFALDPSLNNYASNYGALFMENGAQAQFGINCENSGTVHGDAYFASYMATGKMTSGRGGTVTGTLTVDIDWLILVCQFANGDLQGMGGNFAGFVVTQWGLYNTDAIKAGKAGLAYRGGGGINGSLILGMIG